MMRKVIGIVLIGSFVLSLGGVIGTIYVLNATGISNERFVRFFGWYAGFKNSAPNWPFLVEVREDYTVDVIECEAIPCSAGKMTQVTRDLFGRLDPVTGMPDLSMIYDANGHFINDYAAKRIRSGEILKAIAHQDALASRHFRLVQDVYLDGRSIPILFYLIWSAILGVPGSAVFLVVLLRKSVIHCVRRTKRQPASAEAGQ